MLGADLFKHHGLLAGVRCAVTFGTEDERVRSSNYENRKSIKLDIAVMSIGEVLPYCEKKKIMG